MNFYSGLILSVIIGSRDIIIACGFSHGEVLICFSFYAIRKGTNYYLERLEKTA